MTGLADELLPELLALAVPLEIERQAGAEPQVRIDYARSRWERFQQYGGKGDKSAAGARLTGGAVLVTGGKGSGEEFTILAQVLGALAHQPGGVTAFGHHWCANHAECEEAAAAARAVLREPEGGERT